MNNEAVIEAENMDSYDEQNVCNNRMPNLNTDHGSASSRALHVQRKHNINPPYPKRGHVKEEIPESVHVTQDILLFRPKEPTFPVTFHSILSNTELSDIITWLPHGRSWRILQQDVFARDVVPRYFHHGNMGSFRRQISGWGFIRIKTGPDSGSYYHELFLRGKPYLCHKMKRLTGKNEGSKQRTKHASINPPDFYAMAPDDSLPLIYDNNHDDIASNFQQENVAGISNSLEVHARAMDATKPNADDNNLKIKTEYADEPNSGIAESLRKYLPVLEDLYSSTELNKTDRINAEILIMEEINAHISNLLRKLGVIPNDERLMSRVSELQVNGDKRISGPNSGLSAFLSQSVACPLQAKTEKISNSLSQDSASQSEFVSSLKQMPSTWKGLNTDNTSTSNDIRRNFSGSLTESRLTNTQRLTLELQTLLAGDSSVIGMYLQQRQKAKEMMLQQQMKEISSVLATGTASHGNGAAASKMENSGDMLVNFLLRSINQGH